MHASQFRRGDLAKAGDEVDESRRTYATEMVTSEEAVSVNIREGIAVLRELAKVVISFGQVLSSFAYV